MRNTLVLLGMLFSLVSCSSGGKSVTNPTMDVEGHWESTSTVTLNTCSPGHRHLMEGENVPILFRQEGSDVGLEIFSTFAGACVNIPFYLDGNTITISNDGVWTVGSCSRHVTSEWTIGFTSMNHFDGTTATRITYESGYCGEFEACDRRLAFQGDRCDGCWPGCDGASTSEALVLGMFGISREQFSDAIRKQD